MDLTANQILSENNIQFEKIGYCKYQLIYKGKKVIRPDEPKNCYKLLLNKFGINEPRLKNFK